MVDRELSQQNFDAECSNAYTATIRTFVEQYIITPLVIIRKQRGLPDGLERGMQHAPDERSLGRFNLWCKSLLCAELLMSVVVIDNTARVTGDQLQNFLAACRAKFVKAKIEPGTFLPVRLPYHTDALVVIRFYCGCGRGAVDWRTRNTDDFENVPFCWGGIYECNPRRPSNQGDHQCCKSHQHSHH